MIRLDTLDQRLLAVLGTQPECSFALAQKMCVGNTTIRYRLQRLQKAKLVTSSKLGQKVVWSLSAKEARERGSIKVYRSHDVSRALDTVLNLMPRNSVVFNVQGAASVQEQVAWIPTRTLARYHQTLRRKKISFVGCTARKAYELFIQMNTATLMSHLGRQGGAYNILSSHRLQGSGSVLVSQKCIVYINSKIRKIIILTDKELVNVMYESYTLLFQTISELDQTKTVDVNEAIRQELKRRGVSYQS